MGSERMPGKVLRELAGIPSLVHIFRILRECRLADDFAVVTTVTSEDDLIEKVCEENSVKIIRGSVHDVLDRFRIAIQKYNPKRVIRVTGDDPLMDPSVIDAVINEHITGNYDYTSNIVERTFPRGMDTEVVESKVLEQVWKTTSDKDDHEHVTLFIRRNPDMFRIGSYKSNGKNLNNLRLCMDTEEDYRLIKIIYDNLFKGKTLTLNEVLSFLDSNPELKKINSDILQKKVKGVVY